MYHYVRPYEAGLPYLRSLDVASFRRQLDYFAGEDGFVSEREWQAALVSGEPVGNKVVLTFDDGLRDHFVHVLPELRRRNLWAIFYVPTGPYRTGKLLDVHRIHLMLAKLGGNVVLEALGAIACDEIFVDAKVEAFRELTYRTQRNDRATLAVKRLLNYYIGYEYRERVVDELMLRLMPPEADLVGEFYLRPEELRELRAESMTIGSHTVTHRCLSKLTVAEQEAEIVESFGSLEAMVGALELRTFCYPYGGFHTFTRETERLLTENRCAFAFNVEPRAIARADLLQRRQALPRFDCNQFPEGTCREI